MALSSALFTADGPGKELLKKCAENHAHHIFRGKPPVPGLDDAVNRIRTALKQLGFPTDDPPGVYGKSTAAQVLKFKGPPRMILFPGQTTPDAIVGIQTIHQLDQEIRPKPAPLPEFGSTNWRFTFFGNKGFTGVGLYRLFIGSTEGQDSASFNINELSSDGTLLAGFKGDAQGTFTTAKKVLVQRFHASFCILDITKPGGSEFLNGTLSLKLPGGDELSAVLPIRNLRDETLGTTFTDGQIFVRGQVIKG